MQPDDFRSYLRHVPFRPFRITMTNGATFDIRHPDMMSFTFSSATLGVVPATGGLRILKISLFHVLSVEELPAAPHPGGNGSS
ncbi:MAG: hypothetical protein K2W96_23150 [Gemmataceae bacterium]|nr:hypothetical protein [Gemmataceae bacterium]